jgi:putative two-component system hydrogenase maturation factor HypX/HoxX
LFLLIFAIAVVFYALHFAFYNGAMSTAQCQALRAAYTQALERPTKVIVLM